MDISPEAQRYVQVGTPGVSPFAQDMSARHMQNVNVPSPFQQIHSYHQESVSPNPFVQTSSLGSSTQDRALGHDLMYMINGTSSQNSKQSAAAASTNLTEFETQNQSVFSQHVQNNF